MHLLKLLGAGYQKRPRATYPDDDFPGLGPTNGFRTEFTLPSNDDIVTIGGSTATYQSAAEELVRRWVVNENRSDDRIAVVIVPDRHSVDTDQAGAEDPYLSLKKAFVEAGLPSQMLESRKLAGLEDTTLPLGHLLWTLALNLYVKVGGKPWTLFRPLGNVNCLIGLGFGHPRDAARSGIYIGVANVFDQAGQWLSFASDDRELSEQDVLSIEAHEYDVAGTRSYKLKRELTEKLVSDSLALYSASRPQRAATKVVLHKSARLYEPEALGFLQALAASCRRASLDSGAFRFALVSIVKSHGIRMYGPDRAESGPRLRNTVTRGSVCVLNENTAVIATTGKSGRVYRGIGTPRPVLVNRFVPSPESLSSVGFDASQMYSIGEICEHVLALTKLHWGATHDIRLPVTTEYAHAVARFAARSGANVDVLLKWKKPWWI